MSNIVVGFAGVIYSSSFGGESGITYFWQGKLIFLAKRAYPLPKVLKFSFGGEYLLLAGDADFWQGIVLLLAGDRLTFGGGSYF